MKIPRVIFAGTSSGSGKTSAVCAVLSLLKKRGDDVRSFKCGPDYIDPMFHKTVLGVPCSNLDPFFCDADMLKYLLADGSAGCLSVIEGVMGYYDGTGKDGTENSTFEVAKRTKTPVILVVNAKGASASLLALTEGFLNFVPDSMIKGVLFNRISPMNYANVSKLIKERFGTRIVPVGYIPELPEDCLLSSRHLGLVTPSEITDIKAILDKAAAVCESTVDIDRIVSVADTAEDIGFAVPEIKKYRKITVAAAKDNAFCFYYDDTFRLLEKMGASVKFFSPLNNEPVPEDADGLLLGGGYPELYGETLEAGTKTKESIKNAVDNGMPTIAECGGFQYLGAELDGKKMCGVLSHKSENKKRLVRFGYINITSKRDGLFGKKGTTISAHEFHYYDSTDNGNDFRAVKPNGKEWDIAVTTETLYAGYPHLYLYSNIKAAEAFYEKCLDYKENKK